MILIGTSGFSYADWKGRFYPAGIAASGMLPFYARHFGALEINYTYYRMPDAPTLERMAEKSEGAVTFTVKAHQDLTHSRTGGDAALGSFREALRPLTERGVLGCVLAQFPWSFPYGPDQTAYLARLAGGLGEIPLVVEFRNARWIRPEVFSFLREGGIGFCCVDQPRLRGLVPPVAEATSRIGYVRFHGRNAAAWWRHEEAHERYDYLYSETELAEWVPRIRALERATDKVFVFTNNHYEAKAVTNAKMLEELLR